MDLKGFIKVSPPRFFWIIALSILGGLGGVAGGYAQMYWLTYLKNRNLRGVTISIIILTIFYLAAQSLIYYIQFLVRKQEEIYFEQARQEIGRHYFKDGKFHKIADFQNRMTNDFEQIRSNYFEWLIVIPFYGAALVGALIALITIHWSIFVISIILDIISYYVPKLAQKKMTRAINHLSRENKQYMNSLEKWFNGVEELRRFFALGKLLSVEEKSSKAVENANVEQTVAQQALVILNGLCNTFSQIILVALTGYLIVRGQVIIGAILSVQNFAYNISIGMQQVIQAAVSMKSSKELMTEIGHDMASVNDQNTNGHGLPAAIATENLTLQFLNGEKLSFPDLRIKQGEKILLTGDSGAGKSTLFKLILGDLKPSTGQIIFENKDGQKINPDMSKIGYIPQDPVLFPGSVEDNITMFNKKLADQIDQIIEEVNFSKDIAKFKDGKDEEINLDNLNISGGQRQKIVLARAKIHDSQIILIDEGTSAIDQKNTMSILEKLVKTPATIVFIAHNFNQGMKELFDREIHLVKE